MKIRLFAVFIFVINSMQAQVLIHAHNDYEKPEPLFNAIRNKVFAVEADVYLRNGQLLVAHEAKQIDSSRTLSALYLDRLDSMFKVNNGYATNDKSYKPILVVDIKAEGTRALDVLTTLINRHPVVFNPKKSPGAIYILVSGDRGPVSEWKNYPSTIRFDGRPSETYDKPTLAKVVTISESYAKYFKNKTLDTASLKDMIAEAHKQKKLVRIWGSPDFSSGWIQFKQIGIDIINTDKVTECRQFFHR